MGHTYNWDPGGGNGSDQSKSGIQTDSDPKWCFLDPWEDSLLGQEEPKS